MGYIGQKLWNILWDIFVKNCWIYFAKLCDKLRNVLVKFLGYRKVKLWDILWDIFDKNLKEYICKTMGFIQKNYGINRAETMGYIGLRL